MAILNSNTDLNSIRYAIDIDLSEDDLPNIVIQDSIYLGNAELWVKSIDSDAEARTGDELTHIKNAVKFYTAGLIIPAVRQRVQSTTSIDENNSLSIRFKDFKWAERQQELFDKAYQEVQALDDVADDANIPGFFETYNGGRGAM